MRKYVAIVFLGLACLPLAATSGAPEAAPSPRYSVEDLGTLGGQESEARALNNQGMVVGTSEIRQLTSGGEAIHHAFIWDAGVIQELPGPGTGEAVANGINSRGAVVGSAASSTGDQHAVLWEPGELPRDLQPAPSAVFESSAEAINDAGTIVGAGIPFDTAVPLLWRTATTQVLNDPAFNGGFGYAYAINRSGEIVGALGGVDFSRGGTAYYHPEIWLLPSARALFRRRGKNDYAYGINDHGQVVGAMEAPAASTQNKTAPGSVAFVATRHGKRTLRSLPGYPYSEAFGISNQGQIVGRVYRIAASGTGTAEVSRAVMWDAAGTPHDLTRLAPTTNEWTLEVATALNDRGQIVGNGLHRGLRRGSLLSPKGTAPAAP